MDNTTAHMASAALGLTTQRSFRIASFQVTPNDLLRFATRTFRTHRMKRTISRCEVEAPLLAGFGCSRVLGLTKECFRCSVKPINFVYLIMLPIALPK